MQHLIASCYQMLCDEGVVNKSEESLLHLQSVSDNELFNCALLNAVVNGDSDDDDDIIEDFLGEDKENYKE
jgi:hypothetical protein